MRNSHDKFVDSAIALATTTAIFYAAGTARIGGFLLELKLDSNVLDRDFHSVLYSGFLATLGPAFSVLFLYAALRFAFAHALLPLWTDSLKGSIRNKRRALRVKRFFYGRRRDTKIEKQQKQHALSALVASALLMGLLLTLVYIEDKGRQEARKLIEEVKSHVADNARYVLIEVGGTKVRLIHLVCGSRNCAGLDPMTGLITYFPQSVYSYQLLDAPKPRPDATTPSSS